MLKRVHRKRSCCREKADTQAMVGRAGLLRRYQPYHGGQPSHQPFSWLRGRMTDDGFGGQLTARPRLPSYWTRKGPRRRNLRFYEGRKSRGPGCPFHPLLRLTGRRSILAAWPIAVRVMGSWSWELLSSTSSTSSSSSPPIDDQDKLQPLKAHGVFHGHKRPRPHASSQPQARLKLRRGTYDAVHEMPPSSGVTHYCSLIFARLYDIDDGMPSMDYSTGNWDRATST
jgi:hypothetical protein